MPDGWAFLDDNIEFIYYDDDQYAPHEFGGGWGGGLVYMLSKRAGLGSRGHPETGVPTRQ